MSTKSAAENPKQLTRPKMDNEPMKQKEIAHGESALLARWPIMAQESSRILTGWIALKQRNALEQPDLNYTPPSESPGGLIGFSIISFMTRWSQQYHVLKWTLKPFFFMLLTIHTSKTWSTATKNPQIYRRSSSSSSFEEQSDLEISNFSIASRSSTVCRDDLDKQY